MDGIRKQLADIAAALIGVDRAIELARQRIQHFARRALLAHDNGEEAERKARRIRKRQPRGWKQRAAFQDGKAIRSHARANARQDRAQWWVGFLKQKIQKRENLEDAQKAWQRKRDQWLNTHGPTVNGNEVKGGTARQRLHAAALRAAALHAQGIRRSFYSQAGWWTTQYGITGEPWGARSDCSQWVTAMFRSAGLDDPNAAGFSGGFTGTLVAHGRSIERHQLEPGDLVIYGYGNGFHCEMFVGPGDKTIGHGSAPVDAGTIDMIPGYKRFRSYV